MDETPKLDLKLGLPVRDLQDGKPVLGHLDGEDVIVTRKAMSTLRSARFALTITVRLQTVWLLTTQCVCPWHHACFSLRTGEALRAPALDPSPAGKS